MFKKAVLVSRADKSKAVRLADDIRRRLLQFGLEVEVEDRIACKLGLDGKPIGSLEGDLAVVIGGDGTILRAVHGLKQDIPILSIRLGRVGFLAEVEEGEVVESLKRLISGDFMVEKCFMLKNDKGLPDALNEVMIGAEIPLKTVEVNVYVDQWLVARDRVDAILVATTTGATGYALSAGGCLVDSRVKTIMLVPVCPLSTSFKPYVLPSDSEIRIKALSEDNVAMIVDGQFMRVFKQPVEVLIRKSERTVSFIRFGMSFYRRVKRRLFLSSV